MDVKELLNQISNNSTDKKDLGTIFEELSLQYLKHDGIYSQKYKDVKFFKDWANDNRIDAKDTGIDLVAKDKHTDELIAIQCKFRKYDYAIQKKDVDSFISTSNRTFGNSELSFSSMLFIDTTEKTWSKTADDLVTNQQKSFNKIGLRELSESDIDWDQYSQTKKIIKIQKKSLRDYQSEALDKIENGFKEGDRGKLIMACGTGKTFTSLKIAEKLAGEGKKVLFLAPSLSLISQTIKEWSHETELNLHSLAVCSDSQVGKNKQKDDGNISITSNELYYPANTKSDKLAEYAKLAKDNDMLVVFSTYQSIEVIERAQKYHNLAEFDLIICDEAHRTTGARLTEKDESSFTKVHNQQCIKGKKRLYMTATPRVYSDNIKTKKAEEKKATVCSMDDESLYGKVFYKLSFSDAIDKDLLTDYKVKIFIVDEEELNKNPGLTKLLNNKNKLLNINQLSKFVGIYKSLTGEASFTIGVEHNTNDVHKPNNKAVIFNKSIAESKDFAKNFPKIVSEYNENSKYILKCETEHIDGNFKNHAKLARLDWLAEKTDDNVCRILSNARCLSEGIDVPSLDAVIFASPRKSMVDIVQSVGRIMRKAEGKKYGYVILPIVIEKKQKENLKDQELNFNDDDPENKNLFLDGDNKKAYKYVWDTINALRSHDERLDATINKLDLTTTIASGSDGSDGSGGEEYDDGDTTEPPKPTPFVIEILTHLKPALVEKCGNRFYWADWSEDIAKIAQQNIKRIKWLLEDKTSDSYKKFTSFLENIRKNLNEGITVEEAIEMLAQHLITKPVFDVLFTDEFTKHNPVSLSLDKVITDLEENNVTSENKDLAKFYESIKMRASGIDSLAGKQKIVIELYDKFFAYAFPKLQEKLGIVYTPVEVVDFIIHSVNHQLKEEFGETLNSKNVHIIDPFTGTGTFITRLLQSGIISKDELEYKYKNEIFANEIVLLAYYIASINIEQVYQDLIAEKDSDGKTINQQNYQEFKGICLTDSFRLGEDDDKQKNILSPLLKTNNERIEKQKKAPIKVVITNAPYSIGQKSQNDGNQNTSYPKLENSISESYAKESKAQNNKSLYDSYIKAIRWATDRIGKQGIVGLVTNASFLDSNATDGLRKCLAKDFSSIYIFHLRGNLRKMKDEGQNIFNIKVPTAITILIKNPQAKEQGKIYFYDIGDYHNRIQKLQIIQDFGSIEQIKAKKLFKQITPDIKNDWLNQTDPSFNNHIQIASKEKNNTEPTIFKNYSLGIATNRDSWAYNFSKASLDSNMQNCIAFYNQQRKAYHQAKIDNPELKVDSFIDKNPTKISWSRAINKDLSLNKPAEFSQTKIIKALYRPFCKQYSYFDRQWNEMVYQMPKIFPIKDDKGNCYENLVIGTPGLSHRKGFCSLISKNLIDLNLIDAGVQCFPLYIYLKIADLNFDKNSTIKQLSQYDEINPTELRKFLKQKIKQTTISNKPFLEFENKNSNQKQQYELTPCGKYLKISAITNTAVEYFKNAYPIFLKEINEEHIFIYIYALLHHKGYREKFKNNLMKELPRIPLAKKDDFLHFVTTGIKLTELHLTYEKIEPYQDVTIQIGDQQITLAELDKIQNIDYSVTKIKFAKKGKQKKGKQIDKTTLIYNDQITIKDIVKRHLKSY